MAWKNVIMMHFLNILIKRLSCLEYSKYIDDRLGWMMVKKNILYVKMEDIYLFFLDLIS